MNLVPLLNRSQLDPTGGGVFYGLLIEGGGIKIISFYYFLFVGSYSVTNSTGASQRFSSTNKTSTEQKSRSSFNPQSDLTLICDRSEINELRFFCSELVL